MRIDLRTELLLLDDRLLLVLPGLAGLLILLVLKLAVVHDLAHRRLRAGSHFDKIEVCFVSQLAGVVRTDNANLLAGGTDEANFGNADAFIDTSVSADENS